MKVSILRFDTAIIEKCVFTYYNEWKEEENSETHKLRLRHVVPADKNSDVRISFQPCNQCIMFLLRWCLCKLLDMSNFGW